MNSLFTYLLNLLALCGLIFLLYRKYKDVISPILFFGSLAIKIVAGMMMGIVFSAYYESGDTWFYYNKAKELTELPFNSFWNNLITPTVSSEQVRAIYFTRISSILLYFTKANYWLASVYFSVFSFYACFYFLSALNNWNRSFLLPSMLSLLFFPTAFFWSAGILKESLAFGSVLFILGFYLKGKAQPNRVPMDYFLVVLAIFLLAILKYYVLAVLIPILIYLVLLEKLTKNRWLRFSPWVNNALLFGIMLFPTWAFLNLLHPNLAMNQFLDVIQNTHDHILSDSKIENRLTSVDWLGEPFDFILNVIYFLFSGLFRPLPLDNISGLAILSSIENLLVVVIIIWKIGSGRFSFRIYSPQVGGLILYIVVLAVFLSYSIPNLGALARFKVYYFPFVLMLVLIDHPLLDKISKWKIIRGLW
ncbi:MAG: hypothetical protein JXR07_18660 [Reichenbachiella sp.]